jgi:hypothetical protein
MRPDLRAISRPRCTSISVGMLWMEKRAIALIVINAVPSVIPIIKIGRCILLMKLLRKDSVYEGTDISGSRKKRPSKSGQSRQLPSRQTRLLRSPFAPFGSISGCVRAAPRG